MFISLIKKVGLRRYIISLVLAVGIMGVLIYWFRGSRHDQVALPVKNCNDINTMPSGAKSYCSPIALWVDINGLLFLNGHNTIHDRPEEDDILLERNGIGFIVHLNNTKF